MKLDEYLKDYKSLYPSIVKTFKLSNESIVGIINKKQLITLCSIAKAFKIDDLSYVFKEILPKYLSYDPEVMYAVEHYEQTDKYDKKFDIKNISNGFKIDIEYYPLYDNGVFQSKFENLKEFIGWLKDNNFALMPNGVVVDQNREDAIIAKIIADLMNARDKYKKMMLECRKNGDYDGEATYDTYQTAVKVVNNSCFTKDHSVITLNGVKPINDVKIGDEVHSFNIETRKTVIDTVIDTIEKDYNGELYHINSENKNIFSVTDDHKLVLEDNNGNIVIMTAKELFDEYSKLEQDSTDVLYSFPYMNSNSDKYLQNIVNACINKNYYKYNSFINTETDGCYIVNNQIAKDKLLNILLFMGYQVDCQYKKVDDDTDEYVIIYTHNKIPIFKKDLTKTTFNGKVYCLVVEKNHNFFAGNTTTGSFRLTHNCYGVLALEKFRMFDAKIADAITTTGQLLIRSTIHLTNKYLNSVSNTENEDYVLTTDTDSVIFTLRGVTDEPTTTRDPIKLAKIAEYSKQCQDYINESVYDICKNMFYKYKISKTNNFLTIKNEWLASAGLFVAKKMYVIYMVFNEGIPKEKLKPTGISLKRSSTPAILKPFLEKVINEILSYKTNSEVDTLIIEECEKLKNEYSISDIAIPISLHDLDSYDRIPIHVRGINMWNEYFAPLERDKVNSGKVKYFYVKSWDNNKLNLDKEYVLSVPNVDSCWSLIEGKVTVDYDKMKERLILKPIDAFYSALGWKLPKQTTISHNNIFSDLF